MQFISGNHTENLFQDCAKKKLIYYKRQTSENTANHVFYSPQFSLNVSNCWLLRRLKKLKS